LRDVTALLFILGSDPQTPYKALSSPKDSSIPPKKKEKES